MAALLAPRWRIDGPVLAGRGTLADLYVLGRERIVVELAVEDRRLALTLRAGDPREADAAGLSIGWVRPPTEDIDALAGAARQELAAILRAQIPEADARWQVPADAAFLYPEATALRAEDAHFDEDPDAALLALDAVHYARLFGAATRALRLPGAPGISIHHPAPPPGTALAGDLYPVPEHFHRRAFRRYFAALGCAYDDGLLRTVPTPATFLAATTGALGRPGPWRPQLRRGSGHATTPVAWIRQVLAQELLPVEVAPRWAVELHRVVRALTRPRRSTVAVGILVHDASLHAIGLHAVDPELWQALIRRAREQLAKGGRRRALAVADFFEGTLTRTAWEVWNEVESPAEFQAAFDRRQGALELALAGDCSPASDEPPGERGRPGSGVESSHEVRGVHLRHR